MANNYKLPTSRNTTTVAQHEDAINAQLNRLDADITAIATGNVVAGDWDAGSGSFPSGSLIGTYYNVVGAGAVSGVNFAVGDWLFPIVDDAATNIYSNNWSRRKFEIPIVYDGVASLAASLEVSRGEGAVWDTKSDIKYVELAGGATSWTIQTVGGVKLSYVPSGGMIYLDAYNPAADGLSDDIDVLDKFARAVENLGATGVFGPHTYGVSRSWYAAGTGQYVGHENTVISALTGYDADWLDPIDAADGGVGVMIGKGPVVIYDGRTPAVGDPTRIPRMVGIKVDGGGYAPHGIMFCGILPVTTDNLRVTNCTISRFVIAGCQNAELRGLKSQAGSSLSSKAAIMVINTTKNCLIVSGDMTGTSAAADAITFLGVDTSYPGPGGEVASASVGPSNNKFVKGVLEKIGGAESPLHTVFIEDGDNNVFEDVNYVGQPTVSTIRVAAGCSGNIFRGGYANGNTGGAGDGTIPFMINEGLDTYVDKVSMLRYGGASIFQNNGVGRVVYSPAELFGSPTVFLDGTSSAKNFTIDGGRKVGNVTDRDGLIYLNVNGTRWVNITTGVDEMYFDGQWVLPQDLAGSPTGSQEASGPPLFTQADVASGVLDHKQYRKIAMIPAAATSITSIVASNDNTVGASLAILFANANTTLTTSSRFKLKTSPITPAANTVMTFDCVSAASLGFAGAPFWVQRS